MADPYWGEISEHVLRKDGSEEITTAYEITCLSGGTPTPSKRPRVQPQFATSEPEVQEYELSSPKYPPVATSENVSLPTLQIRSGSYGSND